MKNKIQVGVDVNLNKQASSSSQSQHKSHQTPFRIAILGDFSGQGADQPSSDRRLIKIDRDNFEEVMASFDIKLNLNLKGGEGLQIQIRELEDFHPDSLYEKLETFSKLRSLRRRLKNNNTFAAAAEEIMTWQIESQPSSADRHEEASTPPSSVEIDQDNLLDSILDSSSQTSTGSSASGQVDQLIKSIVAPYVIPAADPRQDEMLSMVDQSTENHMREILHHADFQALESAWLSLYFLIKRLESDTKVQIQVLDISKAQLQAELALDDITSSSVYQCFCNPVEGDTPWSLLLGNYTFNDTIDDVLSLANIGAIAQQAGAPFIAAANETLAGCESFSATPDYADWNYKKSEAVDKVWQMLRQSPVASYIGLVLPRFLLRLPYGEKSKPIESFKFEEMPEAHCHECYLWGNSAFLKAELLARNFIKRGWSLTPAEEFQVDNLPMHYFKEMGETVSQPIAEIWLSAKGGEIINGQGLIPVWSVKNLDAVRSSDFHSIAESGENLAGRWV